ncbi:bifunctional DNA-formamidopyrimidine glycosylase/DNA-(apurinic or apyrimidinic site) lyase [Palleronia sp.]|uniref:bifunctional DNA-formamidopyrimidine glycosylase/DNA-(apurinic or apyrimidinic site) lyase n=1 Tax=Palleronia sp. TaxID=1940284 RepID=UPI0035C78DFF
MPELPEVETVRRGLSPAMEGRVISRAEIRRPDLRWPFPERMAERLEGARITHLGRRSKYLLLTLDRGETLIVHLGMSGRMLIEGAQTAAYRIEHAAPQKHDHVVLHLDDGARITFNDPRRFGTMDLAPSDSIDSHWLLAKLGPEPLGNGFDESHLVAAFRGRNTPVKSALLDQRIVAGLGNIYVCEALHLAGISPRRKAGQIATPRVRALVPAIRETLAKAIEAGGSSLRNYRQADGALGYFQHSFRVYDREGGPCVTPGCPGTIRRIVQSGRSSFYCATCQR